MIQKYIDRFMDKKPQLIASIKESRPSDYEDLLERSIELINEDDYSDPDPRRIHCINDGNYQGTLLFVVPDGSYQPSKYWFTMVSYGSCSCCDSFEAIRDYGGDPVTDKQANEYWTLCLHMIQGMKPVQGE